MQDLSENRELGFTILEFSKLMQRVVARLVPGGSAVKEVLDLHSTLKKRKVEEFYKSFFEHLQSNFGESIDKLNFSNENFIDVFVMVGEKVASTKSKLKLECFKNILINEFKAPIDNQYTQKFIRFADELNELQIFILNSIKDHLPFPNLRDLTAFIDKDKGEFIEGDYSIIVDFQYQKVNTNLIEVEFNVKELISIGLINYDSDVHQNNPRIDSIQMKESQMRTLGENYYISTFGEKLLHFIMES